MIVPLGWTLGDDMLWNAAVKFAVCVSRKQCHITGGDALSSAVLR